MRLRRALLVLALVGLVVLAGCSGANVGGGGDSDGGEQHARDGAGDGGDGAGGGGQSGGSNDDRAADGVQPTGSANADIAAQQALIRTGQIRLQVADFEAATSNLTAAIRAQGGFVSDTRQEVNRHDNQTWTNGRIVFRVPAENYTTFFERARAEGEVLSARTTTEDVTDQLVDLEARLSNLRNERDRLRTLYDEANTTEDVLAVRTELSDVQGEIERLEAQKRSLENRVAYSTVTVTLQEPRPEHDPTATQQAAWYDTPLTSAFLSSVDGVVLTARAALVAVAYVVPYLLAFGLPVVALGYAIRRRG